MTARSGDLPIASVVTAPRTLGRSRRMSICHIASGDLWAGAEVQVATTASYLVEQRNIELSAIVFNDGVLARELRKLDIPVLVLDEHRLNFLQLTRGLARVLAEKDIQIVHTHRYKENILGSIAARLAGVPHVVRTVHGLSEAGTGRDALKFRVYEWLDRATASLLTDRVVAVSDEMRRSLNNAGYRDAGLVRIHNGVDLTKVRPSRARKDVRKGLGVNDETVLIGTVGRLVRVKSQELLLRAARLILREAPDTRFVLVGDGPLKDELGTLGRVLGIDWACMFLGERADVFDLISAMDIFVLPSLHEGIPMVLLEAMALEKPVVGTRVGGVPEVITHGTDGLLVPPANERELANACLELIHHPGTASRMAARARQTVEERFSDRNAHRLVSLYDEALNPNGSRPGILRMSWLLVRGPAEHAFRRLRDAISTEAERRRMRRIRRNPAVLAKTVQSARNILVLCHGNIIRSPFAERRIAMAFDGRRTVSIGSAGLEAFPGRPSHPTAIETARALSVDLSQHEARQVDAGMIAESDLILAMEAAHLVALRKRFPEARAKAYLLTCLCPAVPLEVSDPVDGDSAVFQTCYEHIARATDAIVRSVLGPQH